MNIKEWQAFLQRRPNTYDSDELEAAVGAAVSATWEGGPVEALIPDVVEEFRAISDRLGKLYRDKDKTPYKGAWRSARTLFRLGCAFGDAMESLGEARTDSDCKIAQAQARGVLAVIQCYAAEESGETT